MGGVADTSFGGEAIIYTFNKADWISFLGTAVVIRMFSPVSHLPRKVISFRPVVSYAQR